MEELKEILSIELVRYRDFHLTLMDIILVVAIYTTTWLGLRVFKAFVNRAIKRREWMERSSLYALHKLVSYFAYIFATIASLESVGIDLTIFLAGSAALLVGIGLGIQQIFNDFLSGVILLFGGTVRVGDIVEFNSTVGRVIEIDFRASKIKTRDGITIIVPNSKLISDNVINWSEGDVLTRFSVEVGVAYGSDTELVRNILTSAAADHQAVSTNKPIKVQFKEFGDSSLNFKLLFWAENTWEVEFVRSDIRFEIDRRFRENNVTIPFPQRDVHLFEKKP
ncbi:MAG: mechanosensitive ion channel [Flavobacteriales bacterium]